MIDNFSEVVCGKTDCEVARTGACAEGHDPPRSCPFYGRSIDHEFDDEDESLVLLEGAVEGDRVALPKGELLTVEEVDQFLRWRPATFVTIVGERDSGKTTLTCSIYERFMKGEFAGYTFAGSKTLVGLEKRSHYARVDSGRAQPDTPRTSHLEGLRFAHLSVMKENTRSDLMLSDRAGEVYSRARSNSSVIPDLVEVRKADRLVLLLDGGRLIHLSDRADTVQAVRQLLRALLDNDGIGMESYVQVVTTKFDLLAKHVEREAIESMLSRFRDRLDRDFGQRLGKLSFWTVAARDPLGEFPPAYGVNELFADWLTLRPMVVKKARLDDLARTEFDRLLQRTPMEVMP